MEDFKVPEISDEDKSAIKLLTKNLNHLCPDLKYTHEQVSDDKKAQEYFRTWMSGAYSLDSLTTFINARCSYLYNKTTIGKRAMNNRLDLLKYLYIDDPYFIDELYGARKELKLGEKFKETKFTCVGDAYDALLEQYRQTNSMEAEDDYPRKIAETVTRIQKKFNLADEWYDVLLCQIASPETLQQAMVKNMHLPQKIYITEAYGSTLTMRCFASEISNSDIKVIKEVLKNLPNIPKRDDFMDINDMIASDRENGFTWKEIGEKYKMPEDNIRQKYYYDSKKIN